MPRRPRGAAAGAGGGWAQGWDHAVHRTFRRSSPMSITEADVLEAVRPVQDPELHRSIVDLDMVRNISIDGPTVGIQVALTIPGCPLKNEINTPRDRRDDGTRRGRQRRHRLHVDDRRGTGDAPREAPRRSGRDRRDPPGPRPRRGSRDPLRRSVVTHPGAPHRLRQGRGRQVVGDRQPRHRPGPAGQAGRRRRCRRLGVLDPADARQSIGPRC